MDVCEDAEADYELPEESLPAGRFEDYPVADPGSFSDDYDEAYTILSEAQLKRYRDHLMREREALKDLQRQIYLPVTYRGVRGVFVPETSISRKQGGLYQAAADWRKPSPPVSFTANEIESAADKWSMLVLQEVKKALDEYDLAYRLADELKRRPGY